MYECQIWDWKGSYILGLYSTFGPKWIFQNLFGDKFSENDHGIYPKITKDGLLGTKVVLIKK